MTNRNYNFKIRLNEQQRIKLLLLAAKNGFDNVSQFIRKKVLKQQEQNNLNQRKLSNDYSILDFNMLLKLYEKIKLTKTTDEILNSSLIGKQREFLSIFKYYLLYYRVLFLTGF